MALYLTPRQVAERWSCSARHVRDLIAAGQLRAMRLGLGAWRIAVVDVEAYELARTNGSDSSPSHEVRKAEPIRPVFGVLEETGDELPLPERWLETDERPTARRGAQGKEKAASQRH